MMATAMLLVAAINADTTWIHGGVFVAVFDEDQRRIEWEVIVPTTIGHMWRAWTDPVELATWAGPAAAVDLRPGGDWHIYFDPDAPPGERGGDASSILSFVAENELRLAAGAPLEFPTVRAEKTEFIVRMEPVGDGHVRLHAVQRGWKRGGEWDRAFRAMAHANAEWLNWLHRRFTKGPIDWASMVREFTPPPAPAP
jgi:uncharacterized protein YndB with AHSA1/START domain